jgi:hypothetical protein
MLMVIVGSIYLRFYVQVGVSTFLPSLTPTQYIFTESDSDSSIFKFPTLTPS